MPYNLKILIVISGISGLLFLWLYQTKLLPVRRREIQRWGAAWLMVSAAGFMLSNFWFFAAIVAVICVVVAGKRSDSRLAIYFLLLPTMPVLAAAIPGFGLINYAFVLNYPRILSLVLLVPIAVAAVAGPKDHSFRRALPTDKYALAYCLVSAALSFRSKTLTDSLRYLFDLALDVGVPYYAASRCVANREGISKVLSAMVTSGAAMALIGVFESVKVWRLYLIIGATMGVPRTVGSSGVGGFGMLPAVTTFNTRIVYGFFETISLGVLGAIRPMMKSQVAFVALGGLFLLATMLCFSRGPWVGAAALVFTYVYFGRHRWRQYALWGLAALALMAILSLTSVGRHILDMLPFIGSARQDTITYRQDLLTNGLEVFWRSPFLGSPAYLQTNELEALRQGQGIIDVVNAYLGVALANGLAGLIPFAGVQFSALWQLHKVMKHSRRHDPVWYQLHRSLFATTIAIMVILATVSTVDRTLQYYWAFAGLTSAACYAYRREHTKTRAQKSELAAEMMPQNA